MKFIATRDQGPSWDSVVFIHKPGSKLVYENGAWIYKNRRSYRSKYILLKEFKERYGFTPRKGSKHLVIVSRRYQ